MTGEGITLLNLEVIHIFSNFNTMFNTGERGEPENNNKNKIKISGGGGGQDPGLSPPPLDPRMQNTKYLTTLQWQLHV